MLNAWDVALFRMINRGLASPVTDHLMVLLSSRLAWTAIVLFALAFVYHRRSWRLFRLCLMMGIAVGVSDFVSFQVLKPLVARERPCHQLPSVRLIDNYCGGDYGFPSNHAANGMAASVVAALVLRSAAAVPFFIVTLLVGLSRICLGVHFPGDILGGFVIGGILGGACYWLFCRFGDPLLERMQRLKRRP